MSLHHPGKPSHSSHYKPGAHPPRCPFPVLFGGFLYQLHEESCEPSIPHQPLSSLSFSTVPAARIGSRSGKNSRTGLQAGTWDSSARVWQGRQSNFSWAPCQRKPCSALLPAKVERLLSWHFTCIFPPRGYKIKIGENFSLCQAQTEGTIRQAELLHSDKAHSSNVPWAVLQNPCCLQPARGFCALKGNMSN